MSPTVPIDRLQLDGVVLRLRSALLERERGGAGRPWSVTVASRRLPGRFAAGTHGWPLRAITVTGVLIAGDVDIAERDDDAYGTHLRLVADPPAATTASGDAESRAKEPQP